MHRLFLTKNGRFLTFRNLLSRTFVRMKDSEEREFEAYWQRHRLHLLDTAPARLREERRRSAGMNTAGDWLLAAVPVGVMIWMIEGRVVQSELLCWLLAAVVGIVLFVLTQMVRPYVTGKRPLSEIDSDIRQYHYREWLRGRQDADT